MNYFHKSSSSSPPSSSSPNVNAGNLVKHRGILQSFTQRRLTRQRKLRHVSEQDIGLQGSPDSSRKSRSSGESEHWSISAVPQPLPLPELPSSRRPESTGLNSGQAHLGSPQELGRKSIDNIATILMKPTSDHHSRFSQDVHNESARYNLRLNIPARSSLPCDFSSPVSPQRPKNTREFLPPSVTTSTAKPPDNLFRGFSQDVNVERGNYNSRLKAPTRSAPNSVFSSPAASPRRLNSGDLFPSSAAFQEFQDSLGFASKVSPAKTMHSPDRSPRRSPTVSSPLLTPKSPKRTVFQSHQSFMEWPEISAHPLPLPPGVTVPSQSSTQSQSSITHHQGVTLPSQSSMQPQSTTTHHVTEQPRASSFKGQWQKGKRIGRGTFGTVYLATNLETGASCAMKEVDLIPDDPKSAECVKQLDQEIKVLRQLNHPNIVQYYGSEIVDDHFYIYLEYIHPGSIDKYVHEHFGAITESIVRNFTRHILSGLAYLHSRKTIHRDIKGANLLVDASGVVKLTDFGLAKHLAGQSYNLSLKGSPYWMAPEVMQAAIQNDPNPDLALAVDIWSLGCTIIEMLNGKPPWSDFTGPQAMFKVLNRSPPIPETLSPEGKDFLYCCFRRNPAERPTASMLLEHPFVRNSHDQNVSLGVQAFSAVNLTDKRHTAGDGTKHKDPMSVSAGTRSMNGNLPCSCGNFQHYNSRISSSTEAFNHPHCSMLQVRPSQSSTQLIHGSHSCSPSNISSNVPLGRTHGREVSNH